MAPHLSLSLSLSLSLTDTPTHTHTTNTCITNDGLVPEKNNNKNPHDQSVYYTTLHTIKIVFIGNDIK